MTDKKITDVTDTNIGKMTDTEIKKALEYCSNPNNTCDKCILFNAKDDSCQCASNLRLQALDLINRLQAENKEWKSLVEVGELQYRKQKAEIEDLEKKLKSQIQRNRLVRKKSKAEAYKECIEKVEEIICDNTYPDFDINHKAVNIWKAEAYKNIDDLLKKLIGE